MRGRTFVRNSSSACSWSSGSMRLQVTRAQAVSGAGCARCSTAISHSRTSGRPPKTCEARSRIGPTLGSLSCMASSLSHEVVTIAPPVSRSTSMETPTQPGVCWRAGMISSFTSAMPLSSASGLPRRVLLLAYMAAP